MILKLLFGGKTRLIEITGKALSGEWGTDDESGNGIPVLRTTNFTNNGKVNFNNVVLRTITKKNIEKKYLRKGDIIIEKSGGSDAQPVGRVIFFDAEDNRYLFNNFTGLLRVENQKQWFPKYVFYSLFHNYHVGGTRQFENKTTGLHNLKTDDYVSRFEVKNIPISEQERIVAILDKVSVLIDQRQSQLLSFDTLIKARFVEMFGGIHNSKQHQYVAIEEITSVISGGTPDRGNPEYWEGGTIRWVKTTELKNCLIDDTQEKITNLGMENSAAKIIPVDSILIAMYGQGKTRGMTGYLTVECTTNQACACILPSNNIVQKYLWHYMMLSYDKLRDMAKGGNQPNLNAGIIKKFLVPLPPREMQEAFVNFAEQIDKSKFDNQISINLLHKLNEWREIHES